jgi:hypothetical protein
VVKQDAVFIEDDGRRLEMGIDVVCCSSALLTCARSVYGPDTWALIARIFSLVLGLQTVLAFFTGHVYGQSRSVIAKCRIPRQIGRDVVSGNRIRMPRRIRQLLDRKRLVMCQQDS